MESLAHSKFDCKYRIVFVPKFRKKALSISDICVVPLYRKGFSVTVQCLLGNQLV